jgi:hypothetical protein
MFYYKIISGGSLPPQGKSNGLFLLLGLTGIAALQSSCTTLRERQAAETQWLNAAAYFFISPEEHAERTQNYDFFSTQLDGQYVILDIPSGTRIEKLEYLIVEYPVSLFTADLPEDIAGYLKKAKQPDGSNYFDYVVSLVDRIIFCPRYVSKNGLAVNGQWIYDSTEPLGVTNLLSYHDNWPYRGECLIFLNTKYYQRGDINFYAYISTLVHETAHKELVYLVENKKLHPAYLRSVDNNGNYDFSLNERYAELKNKEFLEALLPHCRWTEAYYFKSLLEQSITKIEMYNEQLGLSRGDFDPYFFN